MGYTFIAAVLLIAGLVGVVAVKAVHAAATCMDDSFRWGGRNG
ncbi:hypothetical protein [Cuneatibacter caecimuris]|uniref:Uncharacterized protein n=1 Tax=Cuneatibacter caecimuris TaxID=1796618 RepID=A0A4V2F599_9FIRM|nr:hypothetical protein [Cuneatibacter caecimuris]RZS92079.1 hypothetical protein EV209_3200 [Cuneatibacter caecimuris]